MWTYKGVPVADERANVNTSGEADTANLKKDS
jgi:hypothetical protein